MDKSRILHAARLESGLTRTKALQWIKHQWHAADRSQQISDHQQSWGHKGAPLEGNGAASSEEPLIC